VPITVRESGMPTTRPKHRFRVVETGIGAALSVVRRIAAAAVLAGILLVPTATQADPIGLDERAAAWTANDTRVLMRAAPRLVDGALAPTFRGMDSRVGAYADWVYGWFSSLLTAWDLAATAAGEAQREIWAGRVPDTGILHDRLAGEVQERFDETVIHPVRTEQAITGAWGRAMERVAALDVALAGERHARIERAAALLRVDPGPALQRYGGPLLSTTLADSTSPDLSFSTLSEIEEGAGGTADRVLVRSLRPLATRALSVTTRLLLAPIAGGLVASPVANGNGLFTAAAAMIAVSAGIWGVDYAANRLDSALTREAFENELRLLIRDAHGQASRIARRHAQVTVCRALADASACDVAAPVAGGGGRG